jgi:hypothetical protein
LFGCGFLFTKSRTQPQTSLRAAFELLPSMVGASQECKDAILASCGVFLFSMVVAMGLRTFKGLLSIYAKTKE